MRLWVWFSEILPCNSNRQEFLSGNLWKLSSSLCRACTKNLKPWAHPFLPLLFPAQSGKPINSIYYLVWLQCPKIANTSSLRTLFSLGIWLGVSSGNILYISVTTSSPGLSLLSLPLEIESLVTLNLSSREPFPENPQPFQKTHPSYSFPLTSPRFVISQGSTKETELLRGIKY